MNIDWLNSREIHRFVHICLPINIVFRFSKASVKVSSEFTSCIILFEIPIDEEEINFYEIRI